MHEAVAKLDPRPRYRSAKVDLEVLPAKTAALKAGQVDPTSPAVTLDLLRANAVVGVRHRHRAGNLTSVGVTCALCHSTVDDRWFRHRQAARQVGQHVARRRRDPRALPRSTRPRPSSSGARQCDPRHHC
jgi:hypothetical protein